MDIDKQQHHSKFKVAKKDTVVAALAVWYMATAATGRELCCRGGYRAVSYATATQAQHK